MCDPVTIAGVALTGLSTGLNSMAASKVQRARDDAMAAERIRQRGLDQEASAINTQSQDRYQDFQGQQDQKAQALADYYTKQQAPAPADAATDLPASNSNITVQEEAKQRAKAKDFTDKAGTALGNMRSFGDMLGDISRLQGRDASQVGQIGGFKQGSSNVLGYELDAANSAGNGLKQLGTIAGGLGGIGINAGLSGKSFGDFFPSRSVVNAGVPAAGSIIPVPTPRPTNIYNLYGG